MQIDETTQPVAPHQPVESQPTLPNLLLGRTLDKTVESQRRRLLAVSIPKSLTREERRRADEALDQLSLTFFSAPNESLANAFGAALQAVKRPPKAALIAGEDQPDSMAAWWPPRSMDNGWSFRPPILDASSFSKVSRSFRFRARRTLATSFSTLQRRSSKLSSIPAISSPCSPEEISRTAIGEARLTRAEVADIAGPKGAWVWIELEKAKKEDQRHRAGFHLLQNRKRNAYGAPPPNRPIRFGPKAPRPMGPFFKSHPPSTRSMLSQYLRRFLFARQPARGFRVDAHPRCWSARFCWRCW